MIPQERINYITQTIDLTSIISNYTNLKQRGQNLAGQCVFCESKTTFTLSTKKRIFKCFSCKKGGSIISFIMLIENLSYPESILFIEQKFDKTLNIPQSEKNNLRGNVYVLELENDHYYIGFTNNIKLRMNEHFNNKGALWTIKHKPIKIIELHKNKTLEYENILTEKYIHKYGYNKVRGGNHLYFHKKYWQTITNQ